VLDDAGYETVAIVPTEYFDTARWPSLTRGFQRVDTTSLPSGKHNAPQVTDAALRVLSEQRERPLYLWMHYYDAHPPYEPLPHTDGHGQSEQDLYEAELTYVDRELGRLLEAIDRRPEPTYAIITADHSTVFHPAPATRIGHYGYDLYSATLHVPLIVHGPGIEAGRVNGLVSNMDVAPTVIDLLRLPDTTSSFEGTSLAPELLAGRRDSERILFHEYYLPERKFVGYEPLEMVSLHQGPWNLVLNRVRGTFELYDWTTDYFEQSDLYEQQSRSPEVRHLKLLLASFLSEFAAPQ
jgi:arylsulfatase A-like enzyme